MLEGTAGLGEVPDLRELYAELDAVDLRGEERDLSVP